MEGKSDPGRRIAYQALVPGTEVFDRDGTKVGTLDQVLADAHEDLFDGLVIETTDGSRFIDAPDVGDLMEHRVELRLGAAEIAKQPRHEIAGKTYEARVPAGRLQDLWRRVSLHRLWRGDRK